MTDRQSFHLRPEGERTFGYAQAVRSRDTLHVSGSLSVNDAFEPLHAGDMAAQVAEVYQGLRRTLEAHGASFSNVVREMIFVTDMEAFLAANAVRLGIYEGLPLPAATAVEIRRLAFPECMVEIEITAQL